MPFTNGHARYAILYARVSTQEQAQHGYSLRQQIERLREYAAAEGYEVLEEVTDPGHSGASLERPGMDRVRDLVAAGGVSVVLAQDRDRFSREPAYAYLLRREVEEHGSRLRSLNDRGDESPEGELTDGILDQLAKYERAKFAERSRRGKLKKAREGRVVSPTPAYGFRFSEDRASLEINGPEMAIVERIFRLAAEGCGAAKIQNRLYQAGISAPKGGKAWDKIVIKRILRSDVYFPHTLEELSETLSPETAARLEAGKLYGVQWYNRHKVTERMISEPDGNGGRRYRKRRTQTDRPREEWLAVPVPAHLPRELVEQARAMSAANKSNERKHLARPWELRGIMRCSCGANLVTKTTRPRGRLYYYYVCRRRLMYTNKCDCKQPVLRAEQIEPVIWEFVSGLLLDPERIRAGMERLIGQERETRGGGSEKEEQAWGEQLEKCARLRTAYQDQQAAGYMTLEELGEKLQGLEDTRRIAQAELSSLKYRRERVEELEADRDALLEQMSVRVPKALESLEGEERNTVYRMLRLQVMPASEGFEVTGAFCDSGPTPVRQPSGSSRCSAGN